MKQARTNQYQRCQLASAFSSSPLSWCLVTLPQNTTWLRQRMVWKVYIWENPEISIQVNQVKVKLMTLGLCAHHHRWVSHQGWVTHHQVFRSCGSLGIAKTKNMRIILIASV